MLKDDCIFCKIIKKSIPSNVALETDRAIAFYDLNPVAPIHLLIVPKYHVESVNELTCETASMIPDMMLMAKKLAKELNVDESGFRLVINTREGAGQSVFHIHMHFLAQRRFSWPPG